MKKVIMLILLFIAQVSFAVSYPAYSILDGSYSNNRDTIEVGNMPPIRSQDGLGICYGFSAWTLYTQKKCSTENRSFEQIPLNQIPSPLYFGAMGSSMNTGVSVPENIPFNTGGNSLDVLNSFKSNMGTFAESCYPFDQFISLHRNESRSMNEAFRKLKVEYDKNKTEGSACTDCLIKSLNDDFNLKKEATQVTKALGKETFDKFLYDVFLKDCQDIAELSPNFTVNGWPNENKMAYGDMINKFKEVLSAGNPVSVSACLNKTVTAGVPDNCTAGHDFIISGYGKSCKPDGTCRETLKVTNSWGQDWQDENNDGWVDAQTLYSYMRKDKNTLGWLTNAQ